jgi:asparagine N-glycosylation enzyme membrane subunit Stt3
VISTLCRVNGPLSVATIVASLVLAVWYLVRSALDRAPSRADLLATALLALLVAGLVVFAVAGLFDGTRPSETATFAGYLITTVAFAPTAYVLARMEPTRWGNLILGCACLVLPVLVLRLQQIASVTGG